MPASSSVIQAWWIGASAETVVRGRE